MNLKTGRMLCENKTKELGPPNLPPHLSKFNYKSILPIFFQYALRFYQLLASLLLSIVAAGTLSNHELNFLLLMAPVVH
jgi:hypothetical protein